MASDHYFTNAPDSALRLREVAVELAGRPFTVTTSGGVFSPDHIDTGTKVLLGAVPPPPPGGHLLDLGCGWGPIALTLALESPRSTVWAVDVNERALDLVRRNAAAVGVTNVNAALPDDVPDEIRFMTIWSNPPIRVGKNELHFLLERWLPRLETQAEAWLVVQRNLGSDSLHRWLQATMAEELSVTRASISKGFRVLRAHRKDDPAV